MVPILDYLLDRQVSPQWRGMLTALATASAASIADAAQAKDAPVDISGSAEAYFDFASLNTDWRTEILAGFTTFMTMAYIVFVNPSILHETGMPLAAVTAATCLSAAFGMSAGRCQHSARR